jgi:hypothetical protein
MKNGIKYSAGLIALYLVVRNGTNSGRAMRSAAAGGSSVIRALQGR